MDPSDAFRPAWRGEVCTDAGVTDPSVVIPPRIVGRTPSERPIAS